MRKIVIAGIGTEIGKTITSAIITHLLQADYWKPVECGHESDTEVMKMLISSFESQIHPPAYSLKAPLSPHHSARLENIKIKAEDLILPITSNTLVIEMAGGVLSPLASDLLNLDFFSNIPGAEFVLVSKNYLGSINHTLLSAQALMSKRLHILGIVFNGEPNHDSETLIKEQTQLKELGRIFPETCITQETIKKYGKLWNLQHFTKTL